MGTLLGPKYIPHTYMDPLGMLGREGPSPCLLFVKAWTPKDQTRPEGPHILPLGNWDP